MSEHALLLSRCIRVTDARKPGAAAAACLQDAHGAAINCLRWHPAAEHQLLSAAAEPAAHLWDLRAPGRPLHALVGHIGSRCGFSLMQGICVPCMLCSCKDLRSPGTCCMRWSAAPAPGVAFACLLKGPLFATLQKSCVP